MTADVQIGARRTRHILLALRVTTTGFITERMMCKSSKYGIEAKLRHSRSIEETLGTKIDERIIDE
jgi:hypothetical protein